jgi:hypothetical protein
VHRDVDGDGNIPSSLRMPKWLPGWPKGSWPVIVLSATGHSWTSYHTSSSPERGIFEGGTSDSKNRRPTSTTEHTENHKTSIVIIRRSSGPQRHSAAATMESGSNPPGRLADWLAMALNSGSAYMSFVVPDQVSPSSYIISAKNSSRAIERSIATT